MKYTNEKVRRQDRLLAEASALDLLAIGEYGILSMSTPDGEAYGIPINYAWDGKSAIYLHCAPEGEKLCHIGANPRVSFCVVGKTQVISDKFTTGYESVIAKGLATTELDDDERMHALELLLDKYSPEDKEVGMKYARNSFDRTSVIRIDIEELSGKTKVV